MTKANSWRWAIVAWMAAVLIGSSFGCTPTSTTMHSTTSRTATEPDKKANPVKPPKDDPG